MGKTCCRRRRRRLTQGRRPTGSLVVLALIAISVWLVFAVACNYTSDTEKIRWKVVCPAVGRIADNLTLRQARELAHETEIVRQIRCGVYRDSFH